MKRKSKVAEPNYCYVSVNFVFRTLTTSGLLIIFRVLNPRDNTHVLEWEITVAVMQDEVQHHSGVCFDAASQSKGLADRI